MNKNRKEETEKRKIGESERDSRGGGGERERDKRITKRKQLNQNGE